MRAKSTRNKTGNDQFGGTADSLGYNSLASAVVNDARVKNCTVRLERCNFMNMERKLVTGCFIQINQKDFHEQTNSNEMHCSVKLSRTDFKDQEQFVVQSQKNEDQPSQTSTQNKIRIQPKRIAHKKGIW